MMKAYFIGGDYDLTIRDIPNKLPFYEFPARVESRLAYRNFSDPTICEINKILRYELSGVTPKGVLIYELP
jgi:hypothetical protein